MVEDVVLTVEQWLRRRRKMLPLAKNAQLIGLLYEYFLGKGDIETKHLISMLLLAS